MIEMCSFQKALWNCIKETAILIWFILIKQVLNWPGVGARSWSWGWGSGWQGRWCTVQSFWQCSQVLSVEAACKYSPYRNTQRKIHGVIYMYESIHNRFEWLILFRSIITACVRACVRVYLSASTSRTVRPWAQLFTIQAVSKAARKPLAQPVPMGQKGCTGTHDEYLNVQMLLCMSAHEETKRYQHSVTSK